MCNCSCNLTRGLLQEKNKTKQKDEDDHISQSWKKTKTVVNNSAPQTQKAEKWLYMSHQIC